MIFLKTALVVTLEIILFGSLGNGNLNLQAMFNALFFASYFGLPVVVLRCAIIHSLLAKHTIKIQSLDFWKQLFLFIGPCFLWAVYGLTSSAESWANSWLPLSLVGYLAGELLAFLLIVRPRLRKG